MLHARDALSGLNALAGLAPRRPCRAANVTASGSFGPPAFPPSHRRSGKQAAKAQPVIVEQQPPWIGMSGTKRIATELKMLQSEVRTRRRQAPDRTSRSPAAAS